MQTPPSRRSFLRAAGVALSLPLLDRFGGPAAASGGDENAGQPPMRMVCLCNGLGLHSPDLFPASEGRDWQSTPYLDLFKRHRGAMTVISGLSHPDVDGGHSSEQSFLTSAPHPAAASFRNSVSLDQVAAEQIGHYTRFATLNLSTHGAGLSWTRSGVQIPAETKPSRVFAKLFLDGSAKDQQASINGIRDGQSILDAVRGRARRLQKTSGQSDRETLDQYFDSVRGLEKRLQKAEEWARLPKPQVDAQQPTDITDAADIIGRQELMYDLVRLALQTDSTRIVTLQLSATNSVPTGLDVSSDWHNLSHHGKDPAKIAQLRVIEKAELELLAGLLDDLVETPESGGTLLDRTMVFFGSNLGNASSHDTKNMPVLLAGGGMDHGRHFAFDPDDHPPLCNVYTHLLQKMGVSTDTFGSSTGVMSELG